MRATSPNTLVHLYRATMSAYSISQNRLFNFLQVAPITILYYDHFITFSEEYQLIWKDWRSREAIPWSFIFNRYFAFFAQIGVLAGNFFPFHSTESCDHYTVYRNVVIILAQVIVGVNLILRVYALYGLDKLVLRILLCWSLSVVGVACWAVPSQTLNVSLVEGCHITPTRQQAVYVAIAWEGLLSFDALVIFLTLFRSYKTRFSHNAAAGRDIISLIVRDGAMYFIIMASANFLNILTFYVLEPALRGGLSTYASCISVTMMSRLMLNLRHMAMTRNPDADSTAFTSRSAIGFKSPAGTTLASTMAELDTNITLHEDSRLPDEERAGVNSTAVEEIPTLSYLAVSNVAGPSGTIRG